MPELERQMVGLMRSGLQQVDARFDPLLSTIRRLSSTADLLLRAHGGRTGFCTSTNKRLRPAWCVARKGVTGAKTDFDSLGEYLQRSRRQTQFPLGLGFGVKERKDIDASAGTWKSLPSDRRRLGVIDTRGSAGVRPFLASLR